MHLIIIRRGIVFKEYHLCTICFISDTDTSLVVKARETALGLAKNCESLIGPIDDVFSDIEKLLVKEKGYFIQNKMFQKRTGYNFLRTSELRKTFYESIVSRFPYIKTRYDNFTKEIESWNIASKLRELFSEK